MKKKLLIVVGVVVLLGAAGALFASRGGEKEKGKPEEPPFRLGQVKSEDLQVSVREVGVVDPETKVDVKSTVSGRVVALKVREGAVVATGDVLAEVEPDVTQAQSLSDVQANVTQAELKLKDAERELVAQKALYENGLIGLQVLTDYVAKRDLAAEGLRAAKMRYRIVEDRGIPISGDAASQRARVTSPMDGVVITKGIELGETVTSGVSSFNAGTVLFTVADLKSLIVRVNLNEVDIAKVAVGQPVRVTLDAYPQKIFSGKVRFVAPAAKLVEKIKVFEVEVALDAPDAAFRTGMSANVEVLGEKRTKALSIPLESLQKREGETVAYRLKANLTPPQLKKAKEGLSGRGKFVWLSENWKDYFEAVPVKAGIATLERVEIVSGLSDGDRVCLEDPTRKKVEKDEDDL
ncbi:MAG: efflux RND transporter periplasmic adaptor subunit [Acidobacteria bacterium]|nr:MAG: efflux RND transporter periplasmic adaptor subunit [Acidobacteriota bacterium]MCE7956377.1 efflux RND transporter periplasmic adaptor subunit [Acidobacteria bacterium ACB2]